MGYRGQVGGRGHDVRQRGRDQGVWDRDWWGKRQVFNWYVLCWVFQLVCGYITINKVVPHSHMLCLHHPKLCM
jgi:hypothetical protein